MKNNNSHLKVSLVVFVILCNSNNNKRLNVLIDAEKTASDTLKKFGNKICLTYSHDSVGCSARRNRTSAKAGHFSTALQLKLRLFFNQDMLMFSGASYLTVEQKQNH